jgi:hypothetical protein
MMPNHVTNEERITKWISKSPADAQFRSSDIAKALNLSTYEVMAALRISPHVEKIPSQRGLWQKVGAES